MGLVEEWKSDSDSAVNEDRDETLSSHADKKEGSDGCLEREGGIVKSDSCRAEELDERTRSSDESLNPPE